MEQADSLRLVTKVARLYHARGLRQIEIAERLRLSQPRVSRLLALAEERGIVRNIVAVPTELNRNLEESLRDAYGIARAHVIDSVAVDDEGLTFDLGYAAAPFFTATLATGRRTIGFTSWSRTLRLMVGTLQAPHTKTKRVVEMLGDLGPPDLQHAAARSTQTLAGLLDAEPIFLRIPGVVPTRELKDLLLGQDVYARQALEMLDDIDLALVGIGTCEIDSPLRAGENYFTEAQLRDVQRRGAVGQVCLRFLDSNGGLVESPLDDLVIGVTAQQLRAAGRRWAVAGGPQKYAAIRAALRGHWVDGLVTDAATAQFLLTDDGWDANGEGMSADDLPRAVVPAAT